MPEDIGNPPAPAAPEVPQGTNPPAAPEGTAPSPTVPEVPFLFTKAKAKEESHGVDPSKLPAELQPLYKGMQADYTRGKQEIAEMRRTIAEERKAFEQSQTLFREYLDKMALQPQRQTQQTDQPADVATQIQQLRDEGRHQEADAILVNLLQRQAQAQIEPIKAQAEISAKKAAFRDIVSDLQLNDPFIRAYGAEVAKQFDAQDPVMQKIRNVVLADQESMQTFLPVVLRGIAIERHAARLESNFDELVERKVAERYAAEKKKANGVPARLIESGAQSKQGGQAKISLEDAISNAIEKQYGG